MRGVRYVIWDYNGTLCDDVDLCIDIMNGMLVDAGLPSLDRDRYGKIFDFPVRRYYERLGFAGLVSSERDSSERDCKGGPFAFETLAARFVSEYERRSGESQLRAGMVALLGRLGARGLESSVLSAGHAEHVERALVKRQVRHLLDDVVGLDDHHAGGKVEAGKRWLEQRRFDREACLLIGDTLHDYEVACALGVRCVLTEGGHHPGERLRTSGAPVVESAQQVEQLLGT